MAAGTVSSYSPGPGRNGSAFEKRVVVIVGAALTVITSLVTYTVTVTRLYAEIRQDIAILQDRRLADQQLHELQHMALYERIAELQRQLAERRGQWQ